MSVGFIRDKLEIKFLILYVAAGVAEPMPLSDVQALTMIDDGIDYFAFSQCLSELVSTDHLRINEEQKYVITPKGLKNSEICQSSLPLSHWRHSASRAGWYRHLPANSFPESARRIFTGVSPSNIVITRRI